ncbi:hypothetical protein [Acinetobacter bereziniae]|nr:hypothetical protein [Acinetobacter bereziniae]
MSTKDNAFVRHRIDDLESIRSFALSLCFVRHRIDDLEKSNEIQVIVHQVRHRIDDLEIRKMRILRE